MRNPQMLELRLVQGTGQRKEVELQYRRWCDLAIEAKTVECSCPSIFSGDCL
jgi:hypothetical protein